MIAAVLVFAGGGGTSFASLEKSKTCAVANFPNEGQGHTYKGKLIQPTDIVPYKTDPPRRATTSRCPRRGASTPSRSPP